MDGFFGSGADGADWKLFLVAAFGLAGVASWYSPHYGCNIAFVGHGAGIDDGDFESDSDSVHIVSGIDVVKGHDDEIELFEEGYFEFLDIFVMGLNG